MLMAKIRSILILSLIFIFVGCLELKDQAEFIPSLWKTHAPMMSSRSCASGAVIQSKFYVAGGCELDAIKRVDVYDFPTGQWSSAPQMGMAKAYAAVTALNDSLYVLGGVDGGARAESEKFDPATNTWSAIANMPVALTGHSAISLGGYIYVLGGWDHQNTDAISVSKYNPQTNSWETKTPFAGRIRSFPALTSYGHDIYFVGGGDRNGDMTASMLKYDTVLNVWTEMPPMKHARSGSNAVVFGGYLYVFGGDVSGKATFEVFDLTKQKWIYEGLSSHFHIYSASGIYDGRIYFAGGKAALNGYEFLDKFVSFGSGM